ncbi:MAG: TM2 domain-containing protein [Clostridia bacterium]|nr:TM2 domain-containing protein [Clostridia bacterium]
MVCRNCGNPMDDHAVVCAQCGVAPGVGDKFCPNCGAPTVSGATVCTRCGVAFGPTPVPAAQAKSKMVAGLLGIFLGGFGVHNFYLGYIGKAIAQIALSLCACGIGGIWGMIEGIMILCGSIDRDANGNALKD